MHREVNVSFNEEQTFRLAVDAQSALTAQTAREWLDREFVRVEAQPINPVGKLLLADQASMTVAY